jgi:transcription elongation factor GreA
VPVLLLDTDSDEEVRYTIVGEHESDVPSGRISVRSPIARALLGRSVEDLVVVRVPKGTREFEVLAIHVE